MHYRFILILMLLLSTGMVQATPDEISQRNAPTFRDPRVRDLVDSATQRAWTPRLVQRLARLSSPEVVEALQWIAESAKSETVRVAALTELAHFDFSMTIDQFVNLWGGNMESDSQSVYLALLDIGNKVDDQSALVDHLALVLDAENNVVLATRLVRKLGEIGFRNESRAVAALQSRVRSSATNTRLKIIAHESLVQLGHFDEIWQCELPSTIRIGNRSLLERPLVEHLTAALLNSPDLPAVADVSHIRSLLREALLRQQFILDDVESILGTTETGLACRSILGLQGRMGHGLQVAVLERNLAGAIRFSLSSVAR